MISCDKKNAWALLEAVLVLANHTAAKGPSKIDVDRIRS